MKRRRQVLKTPLVPKQNLVNVTSALALLPTISLPELPSTLQLSCPLLGVLSNHCPLSHLFLFLTVLFDTVLALRSLTPLPELLPTLLLSHHMLSQLGATLALLDDSLP